MSKLKLGPILDEKPVKLTVELPASTYRDLLAYAEALQRESDQTIRPAQIIPPMLSRFMAADRAFMKARRSGKGGAASQMNRSKLGHSQTLSTAPDVP